MNELPKYHKKKMIYSWKQSGLIYDNIDTLYQHYIETLNCEWCGKVFESTRDRCLDHDHQTGAFRLVVCQKCNAMDSYINYPDGYTEEDAKKNKKKWSKEWYEKNRDKIKEYHKEYYQKNRDKIKEKYTCECGSTLSKNSKSNHLKTFKHLSNTL